MTLDLKATFARYSEDEFLRFEHIEQPASRRHDLCAFLLLDALVPSAEPIVSAAEHDEFFLSTDVEQLAEVATEADILTLVRCGVRYETQYDCLAMFS